MKGQAYHRWHTACPIPVSSFTFSGPAPATSETFASLNLVLRNMLERSGELRATGVDRTPQTAAEARMHGKVAMAREPLLQTASPAGLLLSWQGIRSIFVASISIEISGTQDAN